MGGMMGCLLQISKYPNKAIFKIFQLTTPIQQNIFLIVISGMLPLEPLIGTFHLGHYCNPPVIQVSLTTKAFPAIPILLLIKDGRQDDRVNVQREMLLLVCYWK